MTCPEYTTDYVSINERLWKAMLWSLTGAAAVRMLEIGSFEGRSAVWFLDNVLTGNRSHLTCVDIFPDEGRNGRFDRNTAPYGDRVKKIVGRSAVVLHGMLTSDPRPAFDAVYVDGSHRAADVLLDAVLAWGLLKPGGTLILDDYMWGPELPVDERPELGIDALMSVLPECRIVHVSNQVILQKVMDRVWKYK